MGVLEIPERILCDSEFYTEIAGLNAARVTKILKCLNHIKSSVEFSVSPASSVLILKAELDSVDLTRFPKEALVPYGLGAETYGDPKFVSWLGPIDKNLTAAQFFATMDPGHCVILTSTKRMSEYEKSKMYSDPEKGFHINKSNVRVLCGDKAEDVVYGFAGI